MSDDQEDSRSSTHGDDDTRHGGHAHGRGESSRPLPHQGHQGHSSHQERERHEHGSHHSSKARNAGGQRSRGETHGGRRDDADDERNEDDEKKKADAKPLWREHPLAVGIVAILLIAGVVVAVLIWIHSRGFEKTEDAFIDVTAERVSAQVAGRVTKVVVTDNQDVAAGQPLLELDPADFNVRIEQARAARAQAEAQRAEAQAQEEAHQAAFAQAQASQVAADAERDNAEANLARFRKLRELRAGAVAQEQLDRAETAAKSAHARSDAAARAVAAAQAQVDLAHSQIAAAEAGIKSAAAQLSQAELTQSYTVVKAHMAGRIAGKQVAEGNFVQPGAELMAVVPREVYVTANFKETQLKKMRRGDQVEISVDSYPDWKLNGRVDSVQPAAGQAFSVLPAQNAVGNWVKVVQRVPVKIVLDHIPDDPERRLSPGMSVNVKVSIR